MYQQIRIGYKNVIMITNDTRQLIPSGGKYSMGGTLHIECEKLESTYSLPFVPNRITRKKEKRL